MAVFQSSGFQPPSNTRTLPQRLTQNIRGIDHGVNSGQIVIRRVAVPKAVSDKVQYAAERNKGAASILDDVDVEGRENAGNDQRPAKGNDVRLPGPLAGESRRLQRPERSGDIHVLVTG